MAGLALAALLAAGSFSGYLFAVGRLNSARMDQFAAVLRGEYDTPTEPPPAPPPPPPAPEPPRASTVEEVRAMKEQAYLATLATERAARDYGYQRQLLHQALADVVTQQERLDRRQAEFREQMAAEQTAALDTGFQEELEMVLALQPRLAKEHLLRVWQKQPADAVRLLSALDETARKRIFTQFRTPEEVAALTDLLERVRLQGTPGSANVSGTTAGAAAPQ